MLNLLALSFAGLCYGAQINPIDVLFFDLDEAVSAEDLSYEEQLLVYVFQGLVNDVSLAQPQIMYNAGYMNYDW